MRVWSVLKVERYKAVRAKDKEVTTSESRSRLLLSSCSTDQFYNYVTKVNFKDTDEAEEPIGPSVPFVVMRHVSLGATETEGPKSPNHALRPKAARTLVLSPVSRGWLSAHPGTHPDAPVASAGWVVSARTLAAARRLRPTTNCGRFAAGGWRSTSANYGVKTPIATISQTNPTSLTNWTGAEAAAWPST